MTCATRNRPWQPARGPMPHDWVHNACTAWGDSGCDCPSDAVLHGQLQIGNVPFHVSAIRVVLSDDGVQRAEDPCFDDDLGRVMDICGDGRLMTSDLPGFDGEYVLVVYPHAQ